MPLVLLLCTDSDILEGCQQGTRRLAMQSVRKFLDFGVRLLTLKARPRQQHSSRGSTVWKGPLTGMASLRFGAVNRASGGYPTACRLTGTVLALCPCPGRV